MSYRDTLAEHIRICLLRLLEEASDYEQNNSILSDGTALFGLRATRDMVNTELAWLAEQGLITLNKITATISIARLTNRGLDVATGRAHCPGVKRRGPED
ncbi:VpaChn25_0724 family phage protein [Polycyclovorans algicola]|uniref:VpaChn25_0724 family phage protein n=1 Tax=Polycyclovorans algicola TaxID=616992 RepID=UPI0004A6B917|nr:hypothetical protein [Polycyclovorans algicola]